MAKYKVEVSKEFRFTTTLEIEAETDDEADRKAREEIKEISARKCEEEWEEDFSDEDVLDVSTEEEDDLEEKEDDLEEEGEE